MVSDDAQLLAALRARSNAGEALRYLFFWGHRASGQVITAACFSQWYPAPFELEGERYATAEHFMMAQKAALFADDATRRQVLEAPSPGAAKALGRAVRDFDEATWVAHRFAIVVRGNRAKFAQHPALQQFLRNTAPRVLVEASPVDRIWGIGLAQDDPDTHHPDRWHGLNLLGFALMAVRDA
jgi:ribA/ribD-fused uncharacterized protein